MTTTTVGKPLTNAGSMDNPIPGVKVDTATMQDVYIVRYYGTRSGYSDFYTRLGAVRFANACADAGVLEHTSVIRSEEVPIEDLGSIETVSAGPVNRWRVQYKKPATRILKFSSRDAALLFRAEKEQEGAYRDMKFQRTWNIP